MPTVTCEACQSRYRLPDGSEGKRVRCPKCQGVISVPAAAPAGPPTRILYLSGKTKGQELPLESEVIFGREAGCSVIIPDGSARQAAIKKLPDGWIFRDLGGKNAVPILINDQRLVEKILRDGDKVRIGPLSFQFVQGVDPAAAPPKGAPRADPAPDAPRAAAAPVAPTAAEPRAPASLPWVEAIVRADSADDALLALLEKLLTTFPRAERAVLCGTDARGALDPRPVAARAAGGEPVKLGSTAVIEKVGSTRAPYATAAARGQVFDLLAGGAVMCVPVMLRGRFLGVLYADAQAPDAFAVEDIERFKTLAHLAAVALNETRLEQSIARFQQKIEIYSRYMDLALVERLETAGRAVQTRGEIKKLTVLFTDIRNFTALSEKIEPQKLIAMMNQYFDAMVEAIKRYDGYVNKFIGDSIMAYWGAPDARPMDSLQAVRAAMLMQRNLYFLNKDREREGHPPLFMGVGLHTGNAVVGNVGSAERKEYSALGDTVNTASRIQSLTKLELPIEEGTYRIFLSEATYLEVKDQLRAEALPPQEVKGKAQALVVYSVQGVTEQCEAEERSREAEVPYEGEITLTLADEPESFLARGILLSRAALHAKLNIPLEPGLEVVLQIELNAGTKLEDVRARTAVSTPCEGGTDVEFRFDPLPSKKLRRLEDFLTALSAAIR